MLIGKGVAHELYGGPLGPRVRAAGASARVVERRAERLRLVVAAPLPLAVGELVGRELAATLASHSARLERVVSASSSSKDDSTTRDRVAARYSHIAANHLLSLEFYAILNL